MPEAEAIAAKPPAVEQPAIKAIAAQAAAANPIATRRRAAKPLKPERPDAKRPDVELPDAEGVVVCAIVLRAIAVRATIRSAIAVRATAGGAIVVCAVVLGASAGRASAGGRPGLRPHRSAELADRRVATVIAYLGGYSRDLLVADADPDTGALTVRSSVTGVSDASWLARHPTLPVVYATSEHDSAGWVRALDISDPVRPAALNSQPSMGGAPTHLTVHPSGAYLLTANYGSGNIVVHPLAPDGRIGPATDIDQHWGTAPHAHQVLVDPSGAWILAVDLGDDSVYVYELDLAAGRLRPHGRATVAGGTGPRHLVFHPSGRYTYLICEHRPQVIVCGWDPVGGVLTPGSVMRTVPDEAPTTYPGGGAISADGRYLYTTNRGDDSVATFAVGDTGSTLAGGDSSSVRAVGDAGSALASPRTVPTGGIWPRDLVLDPTERWVYVSNQRSGTVTWLPRDPDSGLVGPMAGALATPAAAVVMFV